MLSNTFQIILKKIACKMNLQLKTVENILKYIENMNIEDYLYAENLESKFKLDQKTILKILTLLEKEDILKKVYKLYCPRCNNFSDDSYETLKDLEEYENCENCGNKLISKDNLYKYVIIFFVVKNNGK